MLLAYPIAMFSFFALAPLGQNTPSQPMNGQWRAWLDCPGGEIPFGLELQHDATNERWLAWLHNGPERVAIGDVQWDGKQLNLRFDPYDSNVRSQVSEDGKSLHGEWVRYRAPGKETRLPFHARHGVQPRFSFPEKVAQPAAKLATRYKVQFSQDKHHSVGLFTPRAGSTVVDGTFLTTLGDYRYLEGAWSGSKLALSCFDGAHAFLFTAKLQEDSSLVGDFWSRDSWHETWTAKPSEEVSLPDPFGLTRFVGGVPLEKLSFPDTDGKQRTLADPAFAGKARLIVLFGTWCPNCNDETHYLVELHKRFKDRGLSILGLAFEFGEDFERNARTVEEYAAHHGAEFPMLVAGTADKKEASKAFPVLDQVMTYPTTLFMTATGEVRAVYTGFSGPASGPAHERMREAFELRIEQLLRE